jgi:hypothetical protein
LSKEGDADRNNPAFAYLPYSNINKNFLKSTISVYFNENKTNSDKRR